MVRRFYTQSNLVIAFGIAMLLGASEAPVWIGVVSAIIMGWKLLSERYELWKPPRFANQVLAVLLVGQVYLQFKTLFGPEPSNTVLLGLAALRVMDYENDRDHLFVVLLGFILVSLKALFSLDIYWLLPTLIAYSALWSSITDGNIRHRGIFLARTFLLSLPLTLALFFIFPRFVVPWALSQSHVHDVGFSDSLLPGNVSELASKSSVVFRAKIANQQVSSQELYWRGAVLTEGEGLNWRPGTTSKRANSARALPTKPAAQSAPATHQVPASQSNFTIYLEPTYELFVFTPEHTIDKPDSNLALTVLKPGEFRFRHSLNQRAIYSGHADYQTKIAIGSNDESEVLTAPPVLTGPAKQWVAENEKKDLKEKLAALKTLFSEQGFVYTLKPGAYTTDALNEFVFKRKKGFCEHYAGAYATLARALGLNAHVVVGYQGGSYNNLGDFWTVTQQDAHAWVEVLESGTWHRVDPASWVAPLRLFIGAEKFFALSETAQLELAHEITIKRSSFSIEAWVDRASLQLEDLNFKWTRFLETFDSTEQSHFFDSLRVHWPQYLAQLFGYGVILGAALFLVSSPAVRAIFLRRVKVSKTERLMRETLELGAEQNIPIKTGEAPLTYLGRLANSAFEPKDKLKSLAQQYDLEIYAGTKQPNGAAPPEGWESRSKPY